MTVEPSFEVRYTRLPSGATISYRVSGDGISVVLMPANIAIALGPPGVNLSGRLRAQMPAARVVAYTHLGGGMSDRDGYDFTVEGLEAELEAVVTDGVDGRFVLVAQAISTPAAMHYAATHPDALRSLAGATGALVLGSSPLVCSFGIS